MISYVRGKLARKAPTRVVVEVGGLGYDLAVSLTTYDRLPALGAEVQLFTHHYVREDRQELPLCAAVHSVSLVQPASVTWQWCILPGAQATERKCPTSQQRRAA